MGWQCPGGTEVWSPLSQHCGGSGQPCSVGFGEVVRRVCSACTPRCGAGDSAVLPGSLIAYRCTLPSNPKAAAPCGWLGSPRMGSALLFGAQFLLVLPPLQGLPKVMPFSPLRCGWITQPRWCQALLLARLPPRNVLLPVNAFIFNCLPAWMGWEGRAGTCRLGLCAGGL